MAAEQWEYYLEGFGSFWLTPKLQALEERFNSLGLDGWEVIGVNHRYNSNRVWITAKRPLSTTARRQRSLPTENW